MLDKGLAEGVRVQVVPQRLGVDPGEVLNAKYKLVIEQLPGLLELREQELRHVFYGQVCIAIRQDPLVRVPVSLVRADHLLRDYEE